MKASGFKSEELQAEHRKVLFLPLHIVKMQNSEIKTIKVLLNDELLFNVLSWPIFIEDVIPKLSWRQFNCQNVEFESSAYIKESDEMRGLKPTTRQTLNSVGVTYGLEPLEFENSEEKFESHSVSGEVRGC